MKRIIPKQKNPVFDNSIGHLLGKTRIWKSEIEFTKVELDFLKELLSEHIVGFCKTNNFQKAKLLLKGLEQEEKSNVELIDSIKEHSINLALLEENIYLKREENFRRNHELIKVEVKSYLENFKYLKKQVFDLVLEIMKTEKQQRLLAN